MSEAATLSWAEPCVTSSEKVTAAHRSRLAVVYVRQSTQRQVLEHGESTRLQYGLREKAVQLGWPSDRVEVIDCDLGMSGATADDREGFQKLISAIALGHVGLVLGVEMSRLARSCKDWYQLLELCALYGTLIADLDGLYDPWQYNDRLLLGLKGTMSEAELHVLRQRLEQGKLQKARRGELALPLPVGYVRRQSGEVTLDPDERARAVVHRIFDEFERLGSIHGVLRDLVAAGVMLPFRLRGGVRKGEIEWRPPCRVTLAEILRNPVYAGAHVYGRTAIDRRLKRSNGGRGGRVRLQRDDWKSLVRDVLPAYITWEQYEHNLAQIEANSSRLESKGSVRSGPALLQGLVFCGRCGWRMMVMYGRGGQTKHARYGCNRDAVHKGGSYCQSMVAAALDEEVVELALKALQPASLEVSLKVCADIELQRATLEAQWQHRLEEAVYEAERAARQYHSVEPENRLVARTLETTWEEKLKARQQLQEEYERSLMQQPRVLSDQERREIRLLARDLPAVWHAKATSDEERKQILRQIIDRVDVTVLDGSERVDVEVSWADGNQTRFRMQRPVSRFEDLSYFPELLERIETLRDSGKHPPGIAAVLNQEGWRPPRRRRKDITAAMVRTIISRHLRGGITSRTAALNYKLKQDEWWVPQLAQKTGVPPTTLYQWARQGKLSARQIGGQNGRWVAVADEEEIDRLRCLDRRSRKPKRRG